ncbi:hypothetical protein [Arthrobacter alpinus]|uniref:hypothetical protein n=1 Tax=Arthrobacter alpinus TaxID=656366 RepID=UPI0016462AE3|nr:hypothetical protein [Arthrobacter alpinus]
MTVNAVDWIITENGPSFTFTTYVRKPAIEVILEQNRLPSDTVLTQISAAAAKIPSTGGCIGRADVPTAAK